MRRCACFECFCSAVPIRMVDAVRSFASSIYTAPDLTFCLSNEFLAFSQFDERRPQGDQLGGAEKHGDAAKELQTEIFWASSVSAGAGDRTRNRTAD